MLRKELILSRKTRKLINKGLIKIGLEGENLQEKLIFKFEDEFVNGQARVEILLENGTKNYITLEKVDETYELPIKSIITKKGLNYIQLVIDEGTNENSIPIFKSEKIVLYVAESINAVEEAPEGYAQWIEIANAKINLINEKLEDVDEAITEANNIDLDVSKEGKIATVTLTKKDTTTKSVTLSDGTSLMFNWDETRLGIKTDEDVDYTYVDLKGATGETGLTPNIQIGNVVTGQTSSVTRTGTNENPLLNFVLEKGEKGETGATGATGNGIASIQKTGTSGLLVDIYTITYTNGTTTTFEVTNGEDGEVTLEQYNKLKERVEDLETNQVLETEPGTNISITNAHKSKIIEGILSKESTQDGTPSPSNPVEIKTVKGYRNLFNKNDSSKIIVGGYIAANDNKFNITGTNSKSIYIECRPNTKYTITKVLSARFRVATSSVIPVDKTPITKLTTNDSLLNYTFTSDNNANYLILQYYYAPSETITEQEILDSIMIVEGEEVLPYIEYNNNAISIQVSDGTNVNKIGIALNNNEIAGIGDYKDEIYVDIDGHCWLNKKIDKITLNGTEDWINEGGNAPYRLGIINAFFTNDNNNPILAYSNYFQRVSYNDTWSAYSSMITADEKAYPKRIKFRYTGVSTLDEFKTWLSTHNTTVYYALETPQLIDLQYDIDIRLFKGINNISNSEDMDMTITYVVDIENVLDSKQDTLISGTNIKTINNQSLLGEGNISVGGGSGGTSDYTDLENKPQINDVTLSGNKSLSDLGIQDKIDSSHKLSSDLIDDTNKTNKFFSGNYNDLSNKPTIPTVPTNVSAFTNDAGYLTQHQDISGKLDTSKVKSTTSTTSGDVYDVTYINSTLGDIESLLGGI